MIRDGKPWYIDYQGGRAGAPQYDIASLVYDAKAYIPADIRNKTQERHLDLFAAATGKPRESLAKYSGAFTLIRLMQASRPLASGVSREQTDIHRRALSLPLN
jgi:aminoglycoside/choline kinase family phosphotransferase